MPRSYMFTKEQVLDAAIELTREKGFSAVSARSLGDRLGTTSRPIFSHFENMADVQKGIIGAANKIYQSKERVELVKKTEEKLAERKIALQRSEDMLLKAQAKREKIISVMNRPKKEPVVKLTPEERAAKRRESLAKAREAKKAEREKLNALLAAIEESGKSVDEIVAELKA